MRVRSVLQVLVAVLCAGLVSVLVPAQAVLGAQNTQCYNDFNNGGLQTRGVYDWPGTAGHRRGAYATASTQLFKLCMNPPIGEDSVSAFFANVVPNNGSLWDAVQLGEGKQRNPWGSTQHYISAWGRYHGTPGCAGYMDRLPSGGDEGLYVTGNHSFDIHDYGGVWSFYIDGTGVGAVSDSDICWSPDFSLWFTETHDSGDQNGGTYGAKFSVGDLYYTTVAGGGWHGTSLVASDPCNAYPSQYPYWCDVTDTEDFDVWTNR